jgi:tape measure domain-containing protein
MPTVDPVILRLSVEAGNYERQLRQTTLSADRSLAKQEAAFTRLERQVRASSGDMSGSLKALAGSFAAYFSGRELVGIIDSFTQFQNKLRVAGVEGSALGEVQDRLFASAQRYGVEIGALGGLFGSLTQASKELGASQEQVFKLTDTVSAALKVSGASAGEASGALQQLGQSLRGTKVQAEEYNSLLDGLFPLLQAAADGSERFGGSVGKLTAAVKDGKVTSAEFFAAILNGSAALEAKAAKSVTTVSQAFTQLGNALTIYVGQAAQTSGTQAALAEGIGALARNIDVIIPAVVALGVALGVGYVANATKAAIATRGVQGAMLGAFGGPVGLLISGLVIAIGALSAEATRHDAVILDINQRYDEMRQRLAAAGGEAGRAAGQTTGVGSAAAGAVPGVESLTGKVRSLADELYRQADAAKKARIATAAKAVADAERREIAAGNETAAARSASVSQLRRGDFLNNIGVLGRAVVGGARNTLSGGRTDREAAAAYAQAVQLSQQAKKELADAYRGPNGGGTSGGGGRTAEPKKTKKGRAGLSAETLANRAEREAEQRREEQQRISDQIATAQLGYLQELASTTQSAAERAKLEVAAVEATRVANEQDLRNNEKLNAAQLAQLISINDRTAAVRKRQVDEREAERVRLQALSLTQDALRAEDDLLQLQSGLAGSQSERRGIELRRLDIADRLERAALAEEIAAAAIAGDTARLAGARKRLADLEEKKALQTEDVRRGTETPGQRYNREIRKTAGEINEDVEAIQVRGLNELNDGLADAIMGAKSLGEAFSNVANQIIGDLIRIAIQQAIIKPLAGALFGGGAGGALSSLGSLFGRASGGYVAPGQMVRVNEAGSPGRVEGFRPVGGGTIVPLGQMNTLPAGGGASGNILVRVMLSDDLRAEVAQVRSDMPGIAVEVVRASAPALIDAATTTTFARMRSPTL